MGSWSKRLILAVFYIGALLSFKTANADVQEFNAIFLKPAMGPNSYIMLRDSQILNQFQFGFTNTFSYTYHPLDLKQGSSRVRGIIDDLIVYDFGFAMSFTHWFEMGLDLPIVLLNRFENPISLNGLSNKFNISDLRVEAKFKPFDSCAKPVGLALIPFITAPTGKNDYYIGDSGITGGIITALDVQASKEAKVTLNLGYQVGKKVKFRNLEYQHQLLYGLGSSFGLGPVELFAELNGSTAFEHFFSSKPATPIEVMGGVKWQIKETGLSIGASAGSCIICGLKGSRITGALQVNYDFMNNKFKQMAKESRLQCINKFKSEYELEDIFALKLKCPPDQSQYKPGVYDDACPKFYELQEVANLVNSCPSNPADFNKAIHDASCLKVYELEEYFDSKQIWAVYELSNAEMSLKCPSNIGDYNPYLHDAECPKYYSLLETIDLARSCPIDPKDFDPKSIKADCAKYYALKSNYTDTEWAFMSNVAKKDTDRDGIPDYRDRCPKVAEDKNGFADDDGCPDGGIVAITGGEIHTYKPITFAFNSAKLDYNAEQMLDQVIGTVNKTPWIKVVRVGGHADERGTAEANEEISKKRALAVIEYMKVKGIRKNVKLVPIAYGSLRPAIKFAKTDEEREKNRRVVFTVAQDTYGISGGQRNVWRKTSTGNIQ